ncbi:MAG: DUF2975 domain-containing protein [Desulfovibrio sp.]
MDRIKRVSVWFKWIFLVTLVALPVLDALLWACAEPFQLLDALRESSATFSGLPAGLEMPWDVRLLTFGAGLLPLGANLVGIYFLMRLFRLYAAGEIFSLANVRCFRWIGWAIIGRQAVDPAYQALTTAALTMHNPAGERLIGVGVSDVNVTQLLIGFVILVISWVMDEGRRLQEEEALVI